MVRKNEHDDARSLDFYERGCLGADPRACLAAAEFLAAGRGKKANATEAEALRRSALGALLFACDNADGEACESLGDFYDGRYGKTNYQATKALRYFEEACHAGRWTSCRDAADLLEKGQDGLVADVEKVHRYRLEACRHGVATACPWSSPPEP